MNKMINIENIMVDNYYDYKIHELKYLIANILVEKNSNYIIIEDNDYQEIFKFIINKNIIKIIEINSNDKIIINNDTNEIIEDDDIAFDIDVIEHLCELIRNNTTKY